MIGFNSRKDSRFPLAILSHQDLIDRSLSGYQHKDRFKILQLNCMRLQGQKSKSRNTLSRICEHIVESDARRLNNLIAVHLINGVFCLRLLLHM